MNIRLQEHDETGRAPNERGHRVVDQVPWTTRPGAANFKSVECQDQIGIGGPNSCRTMVDFVRNSWIEIGFATD
jgi:hypothetical protein